MSVSLVQLLLVFEVRIFFLHFRYCNNAFQALKIACSKYFFDDDLILVTTEEACGVLLVWIPRHIHRVRDINSYWPLYRLLH